MQPVPKPYSYPLSSEGVSQDGVARKLKPILPRHIGWPGERQAVEKALERNLLPNKIIRLFTIQTSLLTIMMVTHNIQITAIVKLWKPSVFPYSAIATQSQRGEGVQTK